MTREEYEQSIGWIARNYGLPHQRMKLFEEMGELITAMSRLALSFMDDTGDTMKLLDEVVTEISDVEIMISQIKCLMNCEAEVEAEKERKILRQFERMERE